ncbi:hypothetical protein [Streptomyces avidinii]|uniref:Uncharacterized protein n=1 Tax=Streptomyces avidinii TaxID=1895 RepID=A0ABS4LGD7_STRAV|nr:hypothetical protein [Streptomyces avidinii]MBP2041172.1 hypothetical protein [Streptomyces avidinii]GGZ04829.1 hypothetical protein GCM10010343_33540 [Streptomyces avidinii]
MSDTIKMSVPGELAELLVAEGHATPTRGRRSSQWGLDGDFITGTATVIALLQAPQTIAYLAGAIRSLASRRRAGRPDDRARMYVEAIGPHGQIRFDGEATVEEIERLLQRTILPAQNVDRAALRDTDTDAV